MIAIIILLVVIIAAVIGVMIFDPNNGPVAHTKNTPEIPAVVGGAPPANFSTVRYAAASLEMIVMIDFVVQYCDELPRDYPELSKAAAVGIAALKALPWVSDADPAALAIAQNLLDGNQFYTALDGLKGQFADTLSPLELLFITTTGGVRGYIEAGGFEVNLFRQTYTKLRSIINNAAVTLDALLDAHKALNDRVKLNHNNYTDKTNLDSITNSAGAVIGLTVFTDQLIDHVKRKADAKINTPTNLEAEVKTIFALKELHTAEMGYFNAVGAQILSDLTIFRDSEKGRFDAYKAVETAAKNDVSGVEGKLLAYNKDAQTDAATAVTAIKLLPDLYSKNNFVDSANLNKPTDFILSTADAPALAPMAAAALAALVVAPVVPVAGVVAAAPPAAPPAVRVATIGAEWGTLAAAAAAVRAAPALVTLTKVIPDANMAAGTIDANFKYKYVHNLFDVNTHKLDPFTRLYQIKDSRAKYLSILTPAALVLMNDTVGFQLSINNLETAYKNALDALSATENNIDAMVTEISDNATQYKADFDKAELVITSAIAFLETPVEQITARDTSGTGYVYPAVKSSNSSPTSYTYRYNTVGEIFKEIDLPTGDTGYLGDY